MAVLVDFNNICFSGIMAQLHTLDGNFEEGLIRHMVMMSILSFKKEYPTYGEVILCCDGNNSWRKDYFEHYKARRHAKKEPSEAASGAEDDFDIEELWRILNLIREEMKTRMPYKVIHLPRVEGDDGIAVLTKHLPGPHVVVSNDKDFGQLQRFDGVVQYSPLKKNRDGKGEIRHADPMAFLKEQIIRGDGIDDVPNILSDDDTFMDPTKRQKSIMKKKMDDYMSRPLSENFDQAKIDRNVKMIDFEEIPQEYVDLILTEYESQKEKRVTRQDMFQYFMAKKLNRLMDELQRF